jgi:CRISPR/Cas system-associated endoribonuclease Cas2
MTDFLDNYRRIIDAAFSWGINNVPVNEKDRIPSFEDEDHRRKSMSACHRGYEKAQNSIFKIIIENTNNNDIPDDVRTYRELVLRNIIDVLAFVIMRLEIYIARRFYYHDRPPKIDVKVLIETKIYIDRLNRESRQTFALIADLTTFIHVTDIVRIDFRARSPGASFIELKTGKINEMLLSQIDNYKPTLESLELIRVDPLIDKRYLPQAERMVRQRIRLEQIQQVLKTDEGMDIKGYPIKLSKETSQVNTYDDLIDKLCDEAMKTGVASGVNQYCLHIGVGYSDDVQKARDNALNGVKYSVYQLKKDNPDGLDEVRSELLKFISPNELYKTFDILKANLIVIPCKPFTLWGIKRHHLINLVAQKLIIFVAFDISSFIWLGRTNRFDVGLSSRKKASEFAQQYGAKCVPRWGGRGIRVATDKGDMIIGSGMITRFICSLESPLQFLYFYRNFI